MRPDERRDDRLTTSPAPADGGDEAIAREAGGGRTRLAKVTVPNCVPREYVVLARHATTGRELSAFVVEAVDEKAARKLCKRNYLAIQSVEPYEPIEGVEKPPVLKFGPPISDKDFEKDYGNRPPDAGSPQPAGWSKVLAVVGVFFGGLPGLVLGWAVGASIDKAPPKA